MQGFAIIAPIVILMVVGAALRYSGFFVETDVACLSKLVYWLISPAILFRAALQLEMDWSSQAHYAAAIYISAFTVAIAVYLFGRWVLRNAGSRVLPVSVLASFRCNSQMVGIPVVMLAFGERGVAPLAIYFAVTEVGYALLTVFSAEFTKGGGLSTEKLKLALIGAAKTPMIWASLAGLLLSAMGFHRLPAPIDKACSLIGDMATGAAILMIGASLKLAHIRKYLWTMLPDGVVRLLIHPAILYLCFRIFPVDTEIMQVAVIITAGPAPNIAFVYAQATGLDAEYAAGLIGATTLLFVLTMPLWLGALQIV